MLSQNNIWICADISWYNPGTKTVKIDRNNIAITYSRLLERFRQICEELWNVNYGMTRGTAGAILISDNNHGTFKKANFCCACSPEQTYQGNHCPKCTCTHMDVYIVALETNCSLYSIKSLMVTAIIWHQTICNQNSAFGNPPPTLN